MMNSSSSSSDGRDDYADLHDHEGHMSSVSPRFFKIIVQDTLRSKKLMLPKKFTAILQEETGWDLPAHATLALPNGVTWEMGVTADATGGVWLRDRFAGFAEFCSLAHGYLLLFKHRGGFKFSVKVYDATAAEIPYPTGDDDNSPTRSRSSDDGGHNNGGGRHDQYSSFSNLPEDSISGSFEGPSADNDDEDEDSDYNYDDDDEISPEEFDEGAGSWRNRGKQRNEYETGSCSRRQRGGAAAAASCTRRGRRSPSTMNTSIDAPPSFKATMTETYISLRQAYIPRWFSERYMKESERVGLKVGEKVWEMKLNKIGGPERKRKNTRITGGWTRFSRDNGLKVGDVCIFQLFDDWATTVIHRHRRHPLLHVTILRDPHHAAF